MAARFPVPQVWRTAYGNQISRTAVTDEKIVGAVALDDRRIVYTLDIAFKIQKGRTAPWSRLVITADSSKAINPR
jgi:hypothetical protein